FLGEQLIQQRHGHLLGQFNVELCFFTCFVELSLKNQNIMPNAFSFCQRFASNLINFISAKPLLPYEFCCPVPVARRGHWSLALLRRNTERSHGSIGLRSGRPHPCSRNGARPDSAPSCEKLSRGRC